MTFTPGPWEATEENVGGGFNIYAGPLRVGHTSIICAVNAKSRALDADEAKANARLAAAAPELYEYVKSSAMAGCATAEALISKIEGSLLTGGMEKGAT